MPEPIPRPWTVREDEGGFWSVWSANGWCVVVGLCESDARAVATSPAEVPITYYGRPLSVPIERISRLVAACAGIPDSILRPEALTQLLDAGRRLRDTWRQGPSVLFDQGAYSEAFKAHADQSSQAWGDFKDALAALD